jgi:hypothetical protein
MMTLAVLQTKKGLEQDDPLSLMLFNIVGNILAIMIKHIKVDNQIEGVIPHLVDGGLSILKYVNDTIFFMKHDFRKVENLKLFLAAFKQLSGLKIFFHRVSCFVLERLKTRLAADLFGCGQGQFLN